jgi:GTP-binding protein LepA
VINKIDLPSANVEEEAPDEDVIGLDASSAIPASAKAGIGIHEILESVVKHVPAPAGKADAPLRALLFDSWYDTYQGVVILVRVMDGTVRPKQKIQLYSNSAVYEVQSVGVYTPKMQPIAELSRARLVALSPASSGSRMPRSAIRSWMPIVLPTHRFPGTRM